MSAGAARSTSQLLNRLPSVRGEYRENVTLARYTWFRVGGPAEVMYLPADRDDLQHFLKNTPRDIPIMVIGVASNLLIRDGGIPGVVIRLRGAFTDIELNEGIVRAGAGALDINVARFARDRSLTGLEFLCGIPGTIGGALRMNAGAYEKEMKDVLVSACAIDRGGDRHIIDRSAMGFRYRESGVPADWIFTAAEMRGEPGDPNDIAARMAEIGDARSESQPVRSRTGGSTFKNPDGRKAWELIDAAGCRGLVRGGAQVSNKHCNFLINTGNASARDLEQLGEEVRQRVRMNSGVELQWEIRRIGEPVQSDGTEPCV
jgi:UDP-N-acetylmuramate dehydrogenase